MIGEWYDYLSFSPALPATRAAVDATEAAIKAGVEQQKKDAEARVRAAVKAEANELQPGIEARVRDEARAGAIGGTTTVFVVVGAGLLLWLMLKR